jgi:hypothetical protein
MPFCRPNPMNGARVNVLGTLAVFEAARQLQSIRQIVYASSAAVIGPEDFSRPPRTTASSSRPMRAPPAFTSRTIRSRASACARGRSTASAAIRASRPMQHAPSRPLFSAAPTRCATADGTRCSTPATSPPPSCSAPSIRGRCSRRSISAATSSR